ncbi:MAG: lytic transglycosylase, partial [Thermodesulfobacteriota bacterium]|nr:lytic transglycosylase [Thermodesulfobacteriota bacterium]
MGRFTRLIGLGLMFFVFLSQPGLLFGLDEEPTPAVTKPITPLMEDFPLPEKLSLCGEPMPLKTRYVYEMLDREFTIVVWNRAQVYMWLKRAGRFFPHIEKRLTEEGLPTDLKYLAVTESSLIPHIRSRAGALGT